MLDFGEEIDLVDHGFDVGCHMDFGADDLDGEVFFGGFLVT
jgi:hypothetical protein